MTITFGSNFSSAATQRDEEGLRNYTTVSTAMAGKKN